MSKIMPSLLCAVVLLAVTACTGSMSEKPMDKTMSSDIPHGCSPATTPCQ